MNSAMQILIGGSGGRAALARLPASGLALAILAGVVTGCGTDARPTQPLAPEAFVTSTGEDRGIGNPLDRPGAVQYDNYRLMQPPPRIPARSPVSVGKTVRESVQSPDAEARREVATLTGQPGGTPTTSQAAPQTVPSTQEASDSYHGWLDVGSVLMQVNGTAIFSDKVISAIEKPLEAEAKKGSEARFRQIAAQMFENQIHVYERDELEYASAQKSLEAEDEQLARQMTMLWRQKKVTESGGSPEMAKRRAAADGWDFDKLVEQQYRLHLVQIFYQKRVIPLIQVSASDIRQYYETHKETEYSTHGKARFRLIRIDPNDYAGLRDEAIPVAQKIRARAATEDFDELARSLSKDPTNRASVIAVGGRDGFVQKGAYRIKEVEEAAWSLQPGQVSDVIQAAGALYIVKLEQLVDDKVQDFDSLEVQDNIRDRLRAEQFSALREKHVAELLKEAITRRNDQSIRQTLEAIVARYPQWAAKS